MGADRIDRILTDMDPDAVMRGAMVAADRPDSLGLDSTSNKIRDDWPYKDVADGRAVQPSYSKEEWGKASSRDPRVRKLMRVRARAAAGLGYDITSRRPQEALTPAERAAVSEETTRLDEAVSMLSPEMGFTEAGECVELDRANTGDGYLEARRAVQAESEDAGEAARGIKLLASIFHVPGKTIRLLADHAEPCGVAGYVQHRTGWALSQRVYFKRWGDARTMDKRNGIFVEPGTLAPQDEATELIHFKNHDPDSDYYGTPDLLATSSAIGVGQLAMLRLGNQLKANPGWSTLIRTIGMHPQQYGDWRDQVASQNRGALSAGLFTLNIPRAAGLRTGLGDTIAVQPLGSALPEAETLVKILEFAREMQREATGISEVYLGGSGAMSRASAGIARQITNELEFDPLARRFEATINATIMRALGARLTMYKVRRPTTTDASQESQILSRLVSTGVLSINAVVAQVNRLLPMAHISQWEDARGNVPIIILREIEKGMNGAGADVVGTESPAIKAVLEKLGQVQDALAEFGAGRLAA